MSGIANIGNERLVEGRKISFLYSEVLNFNWGTFITGWYTERCFGDELHKQNIRMNKIIIYSSWCICCVSHLSTPSERSDHPAISCHWTWLYCHCFRKTTTFRMPGQETPNLYSLQSFCRHWIEGLLSNSCFALFMW